MTTKTDPWDRRPQESDPAWQAFVTYRDMGLERSLAKVATQLGKSAALMERWSRTHSWGLRSHAYDSWEDRQHRLRMQKARRDSEVRNLKVAQGAMNKVVAALMNLDPTKMDAGDVARMMDSASKLERLTLGEPTENLHLSGGHDVATGDPSALSDEDRRARLLMLRRELDSRLSAQEAALA